MTLFHAKFPQKPQKKIQPSQKSGLHSGTGSGTCRLLRLRLAPYSLSDHDAQHHGARFVLFAENSPPGCFLFAQTLSGSSPMQKADSRFCESRLLVRAWGLEPQRTRHRNLNPACLPIPSCPHVTMILPQTPHAVNEEKQGTSDRKCPVFLRISRRRPAGSRLRWQSR